MKFNTLKRFCLVPTFVLFAFLTISSLNFAQTKARTEISIPEIPGYITLKCDFHMHTVFSDGEVWPTVRVVEAWQEGLDAISITDHIENQIHKEDIIKNHNRPYEIAKSKADELGIILIKGAEITRSMPPGHFNAIFLEDIDPLDTENWRDAIQAANDQGAFVFWNHPGWRQPDEIPIWYDEHAELFEKGWFKGIEIANHYSYYPKAYQWAIDKNLTLIGNSDTHSPIKMDFDFSKGEHRPITLIFVEERSAQGIKAALLDRKTAVYYNDLLIGEESFLKPIFKQAIAVLNAEVSIKGTGKATIKIQNRSDLVFYLMPDQEIEEFSVPGEIKLYPGKTTLFQIKGKTKDLSAKKRVSVPFIVKNLLIAPDERLPVTLNLEINFSPGR